MELVNVQNNIVPDEAKVVETSDNQIYPGKYATDILCRIKA